MESLHPKDDVNSRRDSENKNEIDYALTLTKNKNTNGNFSKKNTKKVKEDSTAEDLLSDEINIGDKYPNSILAPFITADKLDILIISEVLREPDILTLEISSKLGIPLSIAHKKRRNIESKVLQATYSLDFKKLGLDIRFADVFVDIKEDTINDFVNQLYLSSSITKNILKLIKIKTPSDGICMKTLYQNSDELFFLMDKVKSYPFVSNVHFSEEIEILRDSTVDGVLDMLNTDPK